MKKMTGYIGRAVTFMFFAAMVAIVLYFQFATPPFAAVPSRSMEPVLHIGTLILVEKADVRQLGEGDIVVVEVPGLVQERYNYPSLIVHRIVRVDRNDSTTTYRIKGDNNPAEDPFTVLPEHIQGAVNHSIPNLGYPILFLHSKQGFYFVISSFAIYLLYVLSGKIEQAGTGLKRGISMLFIGEAIRRINELEQGHTEQMLSLQKELQQQRQLTEKLIEMISQDSQSGEFAKHDK
ncbi:signal peptidase I [Paenibacillus abyssi]|uniref:Signal peptidase I n=1 Tax=Paenibacillus abyssi TaxID=1340531 RepID=A0A917LGS1_9BACL|nr:signal peptidase I [Paenibacillus abyssi]GGG21569.1 hypothetical protein GCM10010916_42850 [Paenibacillus abyssi]